VSDAAANLLSFIPSLGTREVFTFGSGVALPTRMRFAELPPELRPNSEASGSTRSDAGNSVGNELIAAVIERWRSASMNQRAGAEELDYTSPLDTPLQPAAPAAPVASAAPVTPPPSPRGEALRSSLLKKPLDANTLAGAPASPPGYPQSPPGYPSRNPPATPPGYPPPRFK
jgi:hypothetical protein